MAKSLEAAVSNPERLLEKGFEYSNGQVQSSFPAERKVAGGGQCHDLVPDRELGVLKEG